MIKKDDLLQLLNLLHNYKGRTLGVIIGLIVALLIINFGVILSIFILVCMGLGYYLGLRYDNRDSFKDVVNDIFSPRE